MSSIEQSSSADINTVSVMELISKLRVIHYRTTAMLIEMWGSPVNLKKNTAKNY